ncbi:GNAT family N-acetyltransferase [Rhizobium leguminosarum]|uniref:GNAT family N-acetyltransferase n=1 Tax=Rhizobium leguminosarum TaxID=384 RepID=UPI001FDEF926|nr:GNAT family N-acetyltransferase [Rhizobium leguminosarum]
MSEMLQRLVAAGKRTARADVDFVREHYIGHPVGIRCSLAEDDDGNLLGFQSLIRATDGNPYDTPTGWGIVGTHVSPDAARTGVGSQLFEVTRQAAIEAGLEKIEAFIGIGNEVAQAYYERMGFRTYRTTETAVCKCWSADALDGAG